MIKNDVSAKEQQSFAKELTVRHGVIESCQKFTIPFHLIIFFLIVQHS